MSVVISKMKKKMVNKVNSSLLCAIVVLNRTVVGDIETSRCKMSQNHGDPVIQSRTKLA